LNNVNNALEITNFILHSSSEIPQAIAQVKKLHKRQTLIHITSYLHNTVLVQTLKRDLLKNIPEANLIVLQHEDKSETLLSVFTLNKDIDTIDISNEILKELHLENINKNISIKDYRNQLFSRYFTDHLTNLPNVYQLRKDLEESEDFGLVLINIDNFQIINNFYGFMVGDYVLEEVGKCLKKFLPERSIYRLSGDEFAFVLDKNMGFYDLKSYLSELYKTANNIVIKYQDIEIYIDITLASSANQDTNQIFSKVSMALKYAKEMRLPFWIYEDRMKFENDYERNLELSGVVRSAVESSKIFPYYQAIIDNRTSEIIKYECLARLVDKNNRVLSPLLFIPVSKKIKVYSAVTKIIIEKSFAAFKDNSLEFNINLSIEDIMSSDMNKYILDTLKKSSASNRVTFELLESEAIQDFKKVERFISEVKRFGAKIAIDDFGSGYSNFSYLMKMNADYIKIDGALIKDIDVDKTCYLIVETIVEFARKLGIETIAEYVHSSSVLDKVKELGIDYSQGFYIDEPSIDLKK
jgi:diguanylate cyclase (GGDEF)-like protein